MRDVGLLGIGALAVVATGGCVDGADTGGHGSLEGIVEYTGEASVTRMGCEDLSAAYDAYLEDGNGDPMSGVECAWTFSDGGTSNVCSGVRPFATAGPAGGTVVISNPGIGAVVQLEADGDMLYEPLAIDLQVGVPECGLSLAYAAAVSGGAGGTTTMTTLIEPAANLLGHDPLAAQGTVEVPAPGTYAVTTYAENETALYYCAVEVTREVTVVECPGDDEPGDEVDDGDGGDCPKEGKDDGPA